MQSRYPHSPGSSRTDALVENGASGRMADFDGFLTSTSETILGGVLITGGKGRSWEINAGLIWMTVRVESAANVSSLPGIVPNRRIGREHRPGW